MNDEVQSTPPQEEREFEDLSLAEALGDLLRQPFETVRRLLVVTDPGRKVKTLRVRRPATALTIDTGEDLDRAPISVNMDWQRAGLLAFAFVFALIGNLTVFQPRGFERIGLLLDVPYTSALVWWGLSAVFVFLAMVYTKTRTFDYEDEYRHTIADAVGLRLGWLVVAMPLLVGAFILNSGNQFTLAGVASWIGGIAAAAWAFTPAGVNPLRGLVRGVRTVVKLPRTEPYVFMILAIIMVVATYARLNGLYRMPAEMTSDHIEKILDAQRVVDGARDIFFANNGGREPLHFYFLAVLAELSGGQVLFPHLKIAAALESLMGIPLLFILGRVAVGERDRRLGTILGLTLALFAATGYWHLAITRVSLRIMLTPLVTTAFLIYLLRLIRHNRREDAVMAGIMVGIGIYSYQAMRMLPVVAVVAAAYVLIFVARTGRQRWATIFNLIVIASVSFAVFVPLFRYSTEYPDDFWRRAQGRMLGDDVITEVMPDGTIMNRSPTLGERVSAFLGNVPQLGINMRNALLMFTYRGDVAWLHNAPNYPTFDPAMGAFLIVGAAGWAIWAIQKREYAALFLLAVLVLMLVPSVVALANPDENPSNTRASGAMAVAYLFAAFGCVGLISAVSAALPKRYGQAAGIVLAGGTALISLTWANTVIFGPYDDFYQNSWSPQHEAGLFYRGVAESDGAWGNVFILAAAHFFDYRGVALEAGISATDFPNGDIQPHMLAQTMLNGLMSEGRFHLDPDRYIVFMYHVADEAATEMFTRWFPEGRDMIIDTRRDTPWLANEQYRVYRVPPPGLDRLLEFFREQGLSVPEFN